MKEYTVFFKRNDEIFGTFIIPESAIEMEILDKYNNMYEFIIDFLPTMIPICQESFEHKVEVGDIADIVGFGQVEITQKIIDDGKKENSQYCSKVIENETLDQLLSDTVDVLNNGDEKTITDYFKYIDITTRELLFNNLTLTTDKTNKQEKIFDILRKLPYENKAN